MVRKNNKDLHNKWCEERGALGEFEWYLGSKNAVWGSLILFWALLYYSASRYLIVESVMVIWVAALILPLVAKFNDMREKENPEGRKGQPLPLKQMQLGLFVIFGVIAYLILQIAIPSLWEEHSTRYMLLFFLCAVITTFSVLETLGDS